MNVGPLLLSPAKRIPLASSMATVFPTVGARLSCKWVAIKRQSRWMPRRAERDTSRSVGARIHSHTSDKWESVPTAALDGNLAGNGGRDGISPQRTVTN